MKPTKWYENMKLWAGAVMVLLVILTFAAVFAGKVKELNEVSPMLLSALGGGVFGRFLSPKAEAPAQEKDPK